MFQKNGAPLPFYFVPAVYILAGVLLPCMLIYFFIAPLQIHSSCIDKRSIAHEEGYAYSFSYPSDLDKHDLFSFLKGPVYIDSLAVVFENGVPLSPQGGAVIKAEGKGAFFFCLGKLYFSSSDNTDPRTNDKAYTFSGPAKQGFRSSKIFHMATVFLGLLFVLIAQRTRHYSRKLYCLSGGWAMLLVLGLPVLLGSSLFTYMPDEISSRTSIRGAVLWNSVIVSPDTQSYVSGSTIRTGGYPFLIFQAARSNSSSILQALSAMESRNAADHPLLPVARTQIMVFLAAVFLLGIVLTRYFNIIAAYGTGILLILFGWMSVSYLSRIIPEGVLLSVAIGMAAAGFYAGKGRSVSASLVLAAVFISGLWLHPRSIAFGPVLFIPAVSIFIATRSMRSSAHPAAWLPVFIPAVFFLSVCGYNKHQYNAFSLAPFNGFSSISIALEFADPGNEALFHDPKVRLFVERCLERVSLSHYRWPDTNFVNYNAWKVAVPVCRDMFAGDARFSSGPNPSVDSTCNSIFAQVSSVLLMHHPDRMLRHIQQTMAAAGKVLPGGHAFWIALFCGLVLRAALWRDTTAVVCALLIATHYSSLLFTGALQGYLERYALTTQWLLPVSAWLFVIDMTGRKATKT